MNNYNNYGMHPYYIRLNELKNLSAYLKAKKAISKETSIIPSEEFNLIFHKYFGSVSYIKTDESNEKIWLDINDLNRSIMIRRLLMAIPYIIFIVVAAFVVFNAIRMFSINPLFR